MDFHTRSLLLNIIFSSVHVSVEEVNDLVLTVVKHYDFLLFVLYSEFHWIISYSNTGSKLLSIWLYFVFARKQV